jgi:hypothetical protein
MSTFDRFTMVNGQWTPINPVSNNDVQRLQRGEGLGVRFLDAEIPPNRVREPFRNDEINEATLLREIAEDKWVPGSSVMVVTPISPPRNNVQEELTNRVEAAKRVRAQMRQQLGKKWDFSNIPDEDLFDQETIDMLANLHLPVHVFYANDDFEVNFNLFN